MFARTSTSIGLSQFTPPVLSEILSEKKKPLNISQELEHAVRDMHLPLLFKMQPLLFISLNHFLQLLNNHNRIVCFK